MQMPAKVRDKIYDGDKLYWRLLSAQEQARRLFYESCRERYEAYR